MADANEAITAATHVRGVPNPRRVGFLAGHVLRHGVYDFEASASGVAERLGRPVTFVDANGFHDEIVAGAVDPERGRVAWLQCRSKEETRGHVDVSFLLHATVEGRPLVEWSPKTYNPYFGINPLAFEWSGDGLVFSYSEKHYVYRAEFDAAGRLTLGRLVNGEFLPPEEAERRWQELCAAHRAAWERRHRSWAARMARHVAERLSGEIPYERTVAAVLAALFIAAIIVVYFVLPG